VALFVVAGLWSFRVLLFDDNFHTVIPNEVYRSARPSPEALERRIKELNLRSVISLSTRKDKDPWLKAERAVTEVHGVDFYLVRLGTFIPSPATLQQLVYLFDTAKRPLLVHCQAGIERSGLASAAAVLLAGGNVAEARKQFGLTYGFAPLLCSSHFSRVFDDYEHWLKVQAWAHTPERFRHWAKNEYIPYFYRARLELLDVPVSIIKGNKAIVRFRATNTSPQSWNFGSEGDGGVQPGAQLRSIEPGVRKHILLYGDLRDITVAPSKAIVLELEIPPILELGRYQFLVDLVNERVRWFSDMGSEPLRFEIRVEKSKSLPGS
jgi:undecaprenyl-diphosphatase